MDHKLGATRIFRSWLEACDIQHDVKDGEVFIDGKSVDVGAKAYELNSTNLEVSLNAFHGITESFGLGKPVPVDRGTSPTQKVYSDPVLARLRHKEFRTAPNNDAFLIAQKNVIQREAHIFYSKNRRLCQELMYEVSDLVTYGMCWSITFAHRGQIMDCEGDDNARLLTRYLRQRYTELYKSMLREKRGCLPPVDSLDDLQATADSEEESEPVKEKTTIAERKMKAAAMLESGLAAMDHDTLISSLQYAIKGPMYGARRIANHKLAEHVAGCESCKAGQAQAAN